MIYFRVRGLNSHCCDHKL